MIDKRALTRVKILNAGVKFLHFNKFIIMNSFKYTCTVYICKICYNYSR